MTALELSIKIEHMLVARNLRGMANLYPHLQSGYLLRASQHLTNKKGTVLIGTGFPVISTFETDGPLGAIALYKTLEQLGFNPILCCGDPLYSAFSKDFNCHKLPIPIPSEPEQYAKLALQTLKPTAVISIERPGLTQDGTYRNMRGEDITARCGRFDDYLTLAECPTIGIGDGGNEIGMGNVANLLTDWDIMASTTCCDELIIADVSNWAAYGIIAMLSWHYQQDLFDSFEPLEIMHYLSNRGSVDGVTRENTLTEDSLCVSVGQQIIEQLRALLSQTHNTNKG